MLKNSIALFSISGTGNTRMLSSMLKKYFEKYDAAVKEYRIKDYMYGEPLPDTTDYDFIGIGYPIHAFNAPMPVIKFVERLPNGHGQRIFIFKTSGEPFSPNHAASIVLIKKLEKKGYKLIFERHFLMPYNIMFRYPDSLVKQIVVTNERLSQGMACSILNGNIARVDYSLPARLNSFNFRYIMHYGAKVNGKLYMVNKNCTLCKKCIRECPSQNISCRNGKIKFGWNCFMCMSCVLKCPTKAISIGLLDPWALHGRYDFGRIMHGDDISSSYVNRKTAGYFKLFNKYFMRAQKTIEYELGDN